MSPCKQLRRFFFFWIFLVTYKIISSKRLKYWIIYTCMYVYIRIHSTGSDGRVSGNENYSFKRPFVILTTNVGLELDARESDLNHGRVLIESYIWSSTSVIAIVLRQTSELPHVTSSRVTFSSKNKQIDLQPLGSGLPSWQFKFFK